MLSVTRRHGQRLQAVVREVRGETSSAQTVGPEKIRVAFVLTALAIGGAEMMLWKLLCRIDRSRFDTLLIALSPDADEMLDFFSRSGIECVRLGMLPGLSAASGFLRLRHLLIAFRPHIVQGWMYHGNLAATIGNVLARGKATVLWNVRGALIDRRQQKPLSALLVWLSGKLSSSPARILNNSMASALEHEARLGYSASRRVVVPNGFDTDEFRPSPEARMRLRRELGLENDTLLVGLMARWHPMKDHRNFIRAVAMLHETHPEVHYVLAGEYMTPSNQVLSMLVAEWKLQGNIHLLGVRTDMAYVTAALDVAVLASSSGEGFPNVLGEAMSCGVPCVATDVGDSGVVIGDTGFTVPPRNPDALSAAILELIEMSAEARLSLGTRARQRVIEKYSLNAIVRLYEDIYTEMHSDRVCAG